MVSQIVGLRWPKMCSQIPGVSNNETDISLGTEAEEKACYIKIILLEGKCAEEIHQSATLFYI